MASNEPQTTKTQEFEEFVGEPLDTLLMQVNSRNGVMKTVPALNIGFMEVKHYVHFHVPPVIQNGSKSDSLTANEEEWLERASYLEDDLIWLLKLPYHRFWSQVVYDESLGSCLESYLSKAPREHDLINLSLREEVTQALQKIHKLVFLVFLRTSTYKESKMNHMTKETFGRIIYENFLFDVPKIMDLCALYGVRNQQIVSKLVHNIFLCEPKYLDDLHEAARITLYALDNAEEMLFIDPSKHGGSIKLEEKSSSAAKELSISQLEDILSYIADTSVTLNAFLEVYPPACSYFHQCGAPSRIVSFYEQVFSAVEKDVRKRSKDKKLEKTLKTVKLKISLTKTSLVKTFRSLIDTCFIQEILKAKYSDSCSNATLEAVHVEEFLTIFTEIISDKKFLCDYNSLYPLDADIELLTEANIKLDPERLNYIYSGIYDSPELSASNSDLSNTQGARPKSKALTSNITSSATTGLHDVAAILKSETKSGESSVAKTNACNEEQNKNNALIEQMHDILPNLEVNFISACLKEHSNNVEEAITAVFNGWQPFEAIESLQAEENSILKERKSIFDGDEFDVFSRTDVNMENIHFGKSNKTPQSYQGLSNDEDSSFLKNITTTYACEEDDYSGHFNNYDDEYDDTYDSMMIGVKEPPAEGEPDKEEPEEKNEAVEMEETRTRNKLDFCENPEIARQRYEERRQAQAAARNKPGSRRGDPSQNQDSARGKQQKDRHKAVAGNHNRRKQADFKKTRGMY